MRVAALTMMYNEPVWARVWVRHYARQVGGEHCFVLDHGSDDGSAEGLGVAVERLGRSALDEDARAALVSERVRVLLRRYDAVVHTDVDELLVAEPGRHADLRAYAGVAPEVGTAVGLDLQHLPEEEAAWSRGWGLGCNGGGCGSVGRCASRRWCGGVWSGRRGFIRAMGAGRSGRCGWCI